MMVTQACGRPGSGRRNKASTRTQGEDWRCHAAEPANPHKPEDDANDATTQKNKRIMKHDESPRKWENRRLVNAISPRKLLQSIFFGFSPSDQSNLARSRDCFNILLENRG